MKYIKFEWKIYQEVTMVAVEEIESASNALKVQRVPSFWVFGNQDIRITDKLKEINPFQNTSFNNSVKVYECWH